MTRSEKNVWEMALRVLSVLNESEISWSKYPFMVSRAARLNQLVSEINASSEQVLS